MNKLTAVIAVCLCAICALTAGCGRIPTGTETTTPAPDDTIPETDAEKTEEITEMNETSEPAATAGETVTGAPARKITLRIATYNIKHATEGEEKIADVIKTIGADVVGVQEVDYLNTRSGSRDQPAIIAKAAGMPYYRFTRSIDYRGGQYGTLILSKYPIVEYETVELYSAEYEGRALGHAVIDVDGVRLDFFNTHLSYEDTAVRAEQLRQIFLETLDCRRFCLTADFNTGVFTELYVIGAQTLVNDYGRELVTFPSSGKSIDNILLSAGIELGERGTVTESYSDHRPLWADVTIMNDE